VVSAEWDHAVQAPLHWEDDGQAVLLTAEQKGRKHLWRFDLPDRRAELRGGGGWVQGFDKAAGTLVTLADAADHPARVHAHLPGAGAAAHRELQRRAAGRRGAGPHRGGLVHRRAGRPRADVADLPARLRPQEEVPAAAQHPRRPAHRLRRQLALPLERAAFAAQGYVVACVNYHGSSGFGYAFLDSITHRWGELELQDIEAATDWLLTAQPWADPARLRHRRQLRRLHGGLDERPRAAGPLPAYVCHAGCFDWTAMFADDAWPGTPRSWAPGTGTTWRGAGAEPACLRRRMRTPTLVIHGALDYRVPDAQGLAYYNTLKARGVDARLLWFPDENHWVLKPRNSSAVVRRVLRLAGRPWPPAPCRRRRGRRRR
jgi:hypothetical protein